MIPAALATAMFVAMVVVGIGGTVRDIVRNWGEQ